MDSGVRNTLIWLLGFIALVLGLFFYSFFSARTLSDEQYQELGYYGFPEPRTIGAFSLVNQDGEEVTEANLKGEWSLLFFGFTFCPDICPTTMGVLARAMDRLEDPPQVILVSVDPERDTPEALANYVPGFDPAFKGYTGEFDEIVKFATQVNVAFGKVPGDEPGTYTIDHSASIVVVNPEGQYAGFIKAPHNALNIARIMQSLQ